MSYQSLSEKNSIISNLIEIARADGLVNMTEISYIFWIAQQLGISEQELKNLFEKPARHSSPITLRERVEVFHKCITIMSMDCNIAESEVSTCEKIGADLRLDLNKTKTLFQKILENKSEIITLDEIKVHYGAQY